MNTKTKHTIDENFSILNELILKVQSLINPITYEYELKHLMKQCNRKKLFEANPKCFVKLKKMGREIPFLPICNRSAVVDPSIIDLSIKLANKLKDNANFDQIHLEEAIKRLSNLNARYSKPIPKSYMMAGKKASSTKSMKKLFKL